MFTKDKRKLKKMAVKWLVGQTAGAVGSGQDLEKEGVPLDVETAFYEQIEILLQEICDRYNIDNHPCGNLVEILKGNQ